MILFSDTWRQPVVSADRRDHWLALRVGEIPHGLAARRLKIALCRTPLGPYNPPKNVFEKGV